MEKRDEEFVGSKAGVVALGEEIHAGTGRRGDKGHAGGGKENIIAEEARGEELLVGEDCVGAVEGRRREDVEEARNEMGADETVELAGVAGREDGEGLVEPGDAVEADEVRDGGQSVVGGDKERD